LSSEYIFQVENLVKNFDQVKAVDGISFGIPKGQCFGLLGPNGAGKTTTVEMMEGMTVPTSGTILYKGKPFDTHYPDEIGIQFQKTSIQDYLKVGEVLELFSSFYKKVRPLKEVIQECSLEDILDRDHKKLSGGQMQRLLISLALLHDPEVIFLDEPTTGLDPQSRRNFWNLIRKIKERGKTILLTTHYMEEAHTLCDEIAIMDKGKILIKGPPKKLLKEYFDSMVISLPQKDCPQEALLEKMHLIHGEDGGHYEIITTDPNETFSLLLKAGVNLQHVHLRQKNLEDLFLEITGNHLRG
jgi:ABC-2 type transport system ATP-binding protein